MPTDANDEDTTKVDSDVTQQPSDSEKPTAYAWFVLFLIVICRALH